MCMLNLLISVRLWMTLRTAGPLPPPPRSPLSMGFSRQEYWSGLPWPPPGELPDPGMESASLQSPALSGGFFTTHATWKALFQVEHITKKKKKLNSRCFMMYWAFLTSSSHSPPHRLWWDTLLKCLQGCSKDSQWSLRGVRGRGEGV